MLLLDESWLRQRCHPNVINRANIYVLCANKRAKIKDVYGVNSCCVVLRKGSSFPFANAHVKGVVKMSKWTATG